MDTLTRRRFLQATGLLGGAAVIGGAALTWDDIFRAADENPPNPGDRILVILTLYGGNDGLSTVIPYADATYHDERADLAYAESDVLPLDDALGLNPAMPGMHKMWEDKKLAVVRGVGYPKPDRSHFRSMDIWQTGEPADAVPTGWIGRWLDATGDDPLRVINVGSTVPLLTIGEKQTPLSLGLFKPTELTETIQSAIDALSQDASSDNESMLAVPASYRAFIESSHALGPVLSPDDVDEKSASGSSGSAGNQGELGKQLDLVARCIGAGLPTRVYSVSLGGFDTHAAEKQAHKKLVGQIDGALTAFFDALRGTDRADDVVVMTYSEFGRRVTANASQGTDHGTAGPVLLAGTPVVGGKFHGEEPSLTDLADGDLRANVDFRDLYASLASEVLDFDAADILGKGRKPFTLLG